jgi:hypothetical protein
LWNNILNNNDTTDSSFSLINPIRSKINAKNEEMPLIYGKNLLKKLLNSLSQKNFFFIIIICSLIIIIFLIKFSMFLYIKKFKRNRYIKFKENRDRWGLGIGDW